MIRLEYFINQEGKVTGQTTMYVSHNVFPWIYMYLPASFSFCLFCCLHNSCKYAFLSELECLTHKQIFFQKWWLLSFPHGNNYCPFIVRTCKDVCTEFEPVLESFILILAVFHSIWELINITSKTPCFACYLKKSSAKINEKENNSLRICLLGACFINNRQCLAFYGQASQLSKLSHTKNN